MLAASAITFASLLDAFYFLKIIKTFVKIRKRLKDLKKIQTKEIGDLISLFRDKKPYQKLFVSIRGRARMQGDGNIVSTIVTNDLIQKSTRRKFFFDKIPFRNILQNPSYLRPSNLKNVIFGMNDEKNGVHVMIKNLEKADITGALTQRKNFDIQLPETKNLFLTILRTIYDFILGIFPLSIFKQKRKTGQRITYYGFLDNDFVTVTGNAFKDEKGKFYFLRPNYVTKQLTFSIKRLQKQYSFYKILLGIFLLFNGVLLYFFAKWLIKKYLNNLTMREEADDQAQEILPHHQCIICYSSVRSVILKPCRHYALCYHCYYKLNQEECPLCKKKITGIVRVVKK